METITLPRTDDQPVRFRGQLLAQLIDTPTIAHPEFKGTRRAYKAWSHQHWHNISIYRTEGGKYIAGLQYRSTIAHEKPYDEVYVCATATELVETLQRHDPSLYVVGMKGNGPKARPARQKQLVDGICNYYRAKVGEVLAQIPDVAEVVD